MKKSDSITQLADEVRREEIREFMAETGMKAYELEHRAGIGANAIYRFIDGRRSFFLDTWLKVRDAMAEYRALQKAS